jgi:hypothetical protein
LQEKIGSESAYKRVPVIDKLWATPSSTGKLIPYTIRNIANACRKNKK